MTGQVIGLDLSMVASGVCLPSGQCFTLKPRLKGDARLGEIRRGIGYYLDQTRPALAVVEGIPTASRGFTVAIILGMVHGIARTELAERGIPFAYVDNRVLKQYATGSGHAEKRAMVIHANQVRGPLGLVDLTSHDEADAFWLWAVGRHHLGARIPGPLGQVDIDLCDLRDRLTRKVKWPSPALGRATRPVPLPPVLTRDT